MALVKIKEKYQVTLPAALREKAGLEVGDLLEAKVEGRKLPLLRRACSIENWRKRSKKSSKRKLSGLLAPRTNEFVRSIERQRDLRKKPLDAS